MYVTTQWLGLCRKPDRGLVVSPVSHMPNVNREKSNTKMIDDAGVVEVIAADPLLILRNVATGCLIGFDLADLDELIGVLNVFRMTRDEVDEG